MGTRKQECGMVLLTVLAFTMVLSIFLIFILSQNISQSGVSEDQLDKAAQQEWCQGAVSICYSTLAAGNNSCAAISDLVAGKSCSASFTLAPVAGQTYNSVEASCTCS